MALDASLVTPTFSQSTLDSLRNSTTSTRSKFSNYLSNSASIRKQIASLEDPNLVKQNADNSVASKNQSLLEQESSLKNLEATFVSQKAALEKLKSDYTLSIQQKRNSITNLE